MYMWGIPNQLQCGHNKMEVDLFRYYVNLLHLEMDESVKFVTYLQEAFTSEGVLKVKFLYRGGRTRLPKFKFSSKFVIGLHVILKLQIILCRPGV